MKYTSYYQMVQEFGSSGIILVGNNNKKELNGS
jgi:hypothetical protein